MSSTSAPLWCRNTANSQAFWPAADDGDALTAKTAEVGVFRSVADAAGGEFIGLRGAEAWRARPKAMTARPAWSDSPSSRTSRKLEPAAGMETILRVWSWGATCSAPSGRSGRRCRRTWVGRGTVGLGGEAIEGELVSGIGDVVATPGRAEQHAFGHMVLPEAHGLAEDQRADVGGLPRIERRLPVRRARRR